MPTLQKFTVSGDLSKSKVYLFFVGEFNPADITLIMGLEPTHSFQKGDLWKSVVKKDGSPAYYRFSKWCYGIEYETTRDIVEQCDRIVNQLDNKRTEIILVSEKYHCKVCLEIVSVIEHGATPYLAINQKIMDFCTAIKADIDVDIYANPYSESDNTIEAVLPNPGFIDTGLKMPDKE